MKIFFKKKIDQSPESRVQSPESRVQGPVSPVQVLDYAKNTSGFSDLVFVVVFVLPIWFPVSLR